MDKLVAMTTFALAASCTPGPNNIMLTASGVNYGFARSLPHMSGVVIGFAALLLAAASGVAALVVALPGAQLALKIAGSAYLLWLAWKVANATPSDGSPTDRTAPMTFWQAFLFQAINPKGVLTALSAAALFVRPEVAGPDIAAMLAVFSLATVLSVVIWTAFGTVVRRLLRKPRHARIFNVTMALLLVGSILPMVL